MTVPTSLPARKGVEMADENKTDESTEGQPANDAQPVDEEAKQEQVTDGRSWAVEGNDTSGYVGVDPEYRNYANETEKPILTEKDRDFMDTMGMQSDVDREDNTVIAEDQQLPHRDAESQDVEVAPALGSASEEVEESGSTDSESAKKEEDGNDSDQADEDAKDNGLQLRPQL